MAKKHEDSFTTNCFNNWKKALERFRHHQESAYHKEAAMKFKTSQQSSILDQLVVQADKEKAENRRILLKQLSSLRFLLRQGLAIRGHKESEGNLMQLMQLQAEDAPGIQKWLNNRNYLSHDIVNEMITLMGNTLLRKKLDNIRKAVWYSIIADETRDISNSEQLAICIRWVSPDYVIHEDLIGLVHVPSTESTTLSVAIKDILVRCILPLDQCRGQAYDGAANMMGQLQGVATLLEKEQPSAIRVHCLAHCLNLCLQDVTKKSQPIRNALDVTTELSKLILYSPKRSLILEEFRKELSPEGSGIRPLCPTRWTVCTGAIDAVLRNYPAIIEALATISEDSHDDYGRRANGLLSQLEKFETFFGLKLSTEFSVAPSKLQLPYREKTRQCRMPSNVQSYVAVICRGQEVMVYMKSFMPKLLKNHYGIWMSLPYQDIDVLQGVLTKVQILTISHPPKTTSDTNFSMHWTKLLEN